MSRRDIRPYKSRFEYNQAVRLEKNGINFDYEPVQFDWVAPVVNGLCNACESTDIWKQRKYTPDFWFPKSKLFVETKGKFTPENRTAMSNICAQSPHEVRMVFMTDNWLTKKHGMRYSRWCELNGIECAIGSIPLEWVELDKI